MGTASDRWWVPTWPAVVVGVAFFAAMILFMQAGINAAKRSLERSATQPKATEPAPTTSPAEHR